MCTQIWIEWGGNKMKLSDIKSYDRKNGHEYIQSMIDDYLSFYQKKGYEVHLPVAISSKIDSTVHLIGSHISVLKPYFVKGLLPEFGYVMSQPCVRTKNLKCYTDATFFPNWGSMFRSLGTLARPEHLESVTKQAFDLLVNVWQVEPKDIKVCITSVDEDLMDLANKLFPKEMLEVDVKQPNYYRHKLGIEGAWGRNFNFALRDGKSDRFSDIGNVIILENSEKQLGIEVALGTSTILKLNQGLSHVLDCHPLIGLENLQDKSLRVRMEDCIITSMALFNDGLEPSNKHITNRLMKKYMDILKTDVQKANIAPNVFSEILHAYEKREYPERTPIYVQKMLEYVYVKREPKKIATQKNINKKQLDFELQRV